MVEADAVSLLVTLPRSLRKRIKMTAAECEVTMTAFIVAALERAVSDPAATVTDLTDG